MTDAELLELYHRHLDALRVLASDPPTGAGGGYIRELAVHESSRAERAIFRELQKRPARQVAFPRVFLYLDAAHNESLYRAVDPVSGQHFHQPCQIKLKNVHYYN